MPIKSKQKKAKIFTNRDGLEIENCYCRKCMKTKPVSNFLTSFDPLDSNLRLSVCKQCINDMYDNIYKIENSLENTIYKLCKMLNIKYDDDAISMAKGHANTLIERGTGTPHLFGLYVAKLASLVTKNSGISDFTFSENVNAIKPDLEEEELFNKDEKLNKMRKFWGSNFSIDDLNFLEYRFSQWSLSNSSETESERMHLKYICIAELDIEKSISSEGKAPAGLIKNWRDLLESAALKPVQATASSSGKGAETWGMINKMIEETTPSEFYKDKELFSDFDKMKYIKDYIIRCFSNFALGSKEFDINEDDLNSDEYSDYIEEENAEDGKESEL